MQRIIDHFQKYLPLTEAEQELILARVKQRNIKRRQMILQEGFVCRHYTFIVKGCFKMYGVDGPKCLATCMSSGHSVKPSLYRKQNQNFK